MLGILHLLVKRHLEEQVNYYIHNFKRQVMFLETLQKKNISLFKEPQLCGNSGKYN